MYDTHQYLQLHEAVIKHICQQAWSLPSTYPLSKIS